VVNDLGEAGDLTELVGRVTTLENTKADASDLTALAARTTTVESSVTTLDGRIGAVETGKADASALTTLAGRVTTVESTKADASALSALADRTTTVESEVSTKAEAADLDDLDDRVGDVESGKADNSAVTTLAGRVATVENTKADASDLTALAGRVTTVESSVSTTIGDLDALDDRVAAVEDGKADNSTVTTLAGRVTTVETSKADASDLTALAGRVTTVESTVTGKADTSALNTLAGRVTTVESTKADASSLSTLAGRVTTVEAAVGSAGDAASPSGSLYARVKDEASVRAGADGYLSGKRTLLVDVNGVVTGMEITSSSAPNAGTTSSIVFSADNVQFRKSGTNKSPLLSGDAAADVNAGATTISGAKLTTGSVTADRLSVSSLSAITADLGTVTAGSLSIGSGLQQATFEVGEISQGLFSVQSGTTGGTNVYMSGAGGSIVFACPSAPIPAGMSMRDSSGVELGSISNGAAALRAVAVNASTSIGSYITYGSNLGPVQDGYALNVIHRQNSPGKHGLFVGANWALREIQVLRVAQIDASNGTAYPAFDVRCDKTSKFFGDVYDANDDRILTTRQTGPTAATDSYTPSGTYTSDMGALKTTVAGLTSKFNQLLTAIKAHGLCS
jgi:uncharacterized protein YbcI